MPKRNGPTDEELIELHKRYQGNVTAISRFLNKPRATVEHWYKKQLNLPATGTPGVGAIEKAEALAAEPKPVLPELPDGKLPTEHVLEYLQKHSEKQMEYKDARRWFPIKMPEDRPIGVAFVGDPHLGDSGCNYKLLRRDVDIMANTDGMYAVNIGDVANNWIGTLQRLYGEQESSRATERQLADWFLNESGVSWLVWLMGNHDLWGDFSEVLRGYNIKKIPMEDWQAQFKLVFPNGRECKIWASHNFRGHSLWNSLHGPQKAAHTKAQADIYAAGHTHNWALHQEESASKRFVYWLARSRGYKFVDEYADRLGHQPQKEGATVCAIIDPHADTMAGFVQCFADLEKAASYLEWLRNNR